MTVLPKSILLIGNLSNNLTLEFANYMSKSSTVYVLWNVEEGNQITQLNSNVRIFYGSAQNVALVQRIINEYKVNVIFHINYPLNVDEINDGKIVISSAKQTLSTLTHFLEAVQKCDTSAQPHIFEVFCSNTEIPLLEGRISGSFKAKTIDEANFASAVALLHSYAISYRLNIQVVNFNVVEEEAGNNVTKVCDFLCEIATQQQSNIKINNFNIPKIATASVPASNNSKIAARYLLYGKGTELFNKFVGPLEQNGIEYIVSDLRPESNSESAIESEIIGVAPSHIVYLPQLPANNESISSYNDTGPQNLLKNTRDNLFGALNIASACAKLGGIHFTYCGAENIHTLSNLLVNDQMAQTEANTADTETPDCYCVMKQFTNSSLVFFRDNSLNLRVQFNDGSVAQETKLASTLFNLSLSQSVGEHCFGFDH